MIPKELLAALRKIAIVTDKLANDQLSGAYVSSFRGQGLAFREVRPYQAGDDVRTIDWNVSARMNEPFIKLFVEEREMTVMLVVDLSLSENFGTRRAFKSRVLSEVVALLSFSAIRHGDRIGLITVSDRVERILPPKRGDKHAMRVVRDVFAHTPTAAPSKPQGPWPMGAGTNLGEGLRTLVRVARRRSVAFVMSDYFDTTHEHALALAAAKHDLIPIVLVDACDNELPDAGLVTFQDVESGQTLVVDTSDTRVRAHYAHAMKEWRASQRRMFSKYGLDVVEIDTGRSFVQPIRELFQRRARRARA